MQGFETAHERRGKMPVPIYPELPLNTQTRMPGEHDGFSPPQSGGAPAWADLTFSHASAPNAPDCTAEQHISYGDTQVHTITPPGSHNHHNHLTMAGQNRPATESGMGWVQGSSLAFKDVFYVVKVKDPKTKKMVNRPILAGVTGTMQSGTLNAIMGASGGGKTSLLDVLADRKEPGQVQGEVLVDGNERDRRIFKHNSGYVVQDDVVMGTLTVRENLMFSAELRLHGSMSRKEKEKRVQNVIEELGLEKVAESRVGNEFTRGISGGERKRVNIGMELITDPKVLFLDEPTTGLDATTSSSVLALLKRLAEHGRTIILSIHQPRFKIFDMFDSLTLLSEGQMVYHGPAPKVVPYFLSIGYACSDLNNPADYVLDVVSGEEIRIGDKKAPADCDDAEEKRANIKACQQYLYDKYNQSMYAQAAEKAFIEEKANATQNKSLLSYRGTYAASWGHQVWVCSVRALRNVIRNPATSIGQVVVNMIVGVVTGVIFLRVDLQLDIQRTIRDRTGCLFFIAVNLMFSNMGAIEIFLKERVIFVHEKAAGYYTVSAYFMSKIVCDIIPVRVIPTIFFSIVVYFMVGLQRTAANFFWFLLTAELQNVCAASVCLLFSSLISVFAVANLATTMFYVFMMILSGLLVTINTWPDYTRWLGYLSFTKYSYELFVENEFSGLTFACDGLGEPCTGEVILSDKYLHIETGRKGIKVMALLIYIAGVLLLSYIALARLKKKN